MKRNFRVFSLFHREIDNYTVCLFLSEARNFGAFLSGVSVTILSDICTLVTRHLNHLIFIAMGKFKKNVTIQFFYPHALNLQYFYLHLLLKCVI